MILSMISLDFVQKIKKATNSVFEKRKAHINCGPFLIYGFIGPYPNKCLNSGALNM
jgi:hypothetical protein